MSHHHLYLSQLASINLQLQHKRLLSSTSTSPHHLGGEGGAEGVHLPPPLNGRHLHPSQGAGGA